MATQVNKKFVIFLVLAIAVGGMLVGGLYALRVGGSVARNARLGEEALQKGDYKAARDHYGRAVRKEPGNIEYLRRLEEATLKLVPKDSVEARDLYRGWVGILAHATRYDSKNPVAHVRLLNELVSAARVTQTGWNAIEVPADEMFRALPPTEPKRYLGKVYKSMAVYRRLRVATEDQITQAEIDAREAVEHLPENDLAWATMIQAQLVTAERLREQGRSGAVVDEQIAKVMQAMDDAIAAVPNGPETARMRLFGLLILRANNSATISDEQIEIAAQHLENLFNPSMDPALVAESADLLAAVSAGRQSRVVELMAAYVDAHPSRLNLHVSLGILHMMMNNLDAAEASAKKVVNSEPLSVSVLSQLQQELKKMAGSQLMDISGRRWLAASEAERPQRLAEMEAAREQLAQLVLDRENDAQLMRADARLAFNTRDFAKAARLYDRLVRETNMGADPETLYFSSASLEQIGNIGLAHERILQALQLNPVSTPLLIAKARLEINMGMRSEASETLRLIPQSELANNPEWAELTNAISQMSEGDDPLTELAQDPVSKSLLKVNQALARNDQVSARAALDEAIASEPNNVRLLTGLAAIELWKGNNDEAKVFVDRGLAIDPGNIALMQYDAILKHGDPIVASRELHQSIVSDERERLVSMLGTMKRLVADHEANAARFDVAGDAENAAKSREIVARGTQEVATLKQQAEQTMPNYSRFIEFLLEEAIHDKDWARADAIVARSRAADADQAGGSYHKGRLETARALALSGEGKTQESRQFFVEAVRSFETASDRLSFSSAVWKSLAFAHQSLGQYAAAERALEQGYKCNPNDLDVVRAYYAILLRRGDETRALRIIRNARQFVPHDAALRHTWLSLEAQIGDRALALRLRRSLARDFPDDTANALELAKLLSNTEPSRETMVDMDGNPIYNDQRWARMTAEDRSRAIEQAKVAWAQQSDELMRKLATQLGDDLRLASARANVLRDRGDIEGGAKALKDFIASRPEGEVTVEMLLELARYQARVNHFADAITTLQQAIALQDPETRVADQELGQLYMRLARYDSALEHLTKASEVSGNPLVENQLIESLMKLKRFDEAEARLRTVVARDGDTMITILLAANIAEGRGSDLLAKGDKAGAEQKFAQQREAYVRAAAVDPTSTVPHLLQAQWFVAEFRRTARATALNDAMQILDTADKVRAGQVEIATMRVAVFKEMGDRTAAAGELRRLLERHPDQHAARRELAQMYMETSQPDAAISLLEEGIRNNPTIGMWHEALGDLMRLMRSDNAAALASYNRAFEIQPAPMLLGKLADAAFATGSADCRTLLNRFEARLADIERYPFLREYYARILHCLQRRDEAIEQLRLAYQRRAELLAEQAISAADIGTWFKAVHAVFGVPNVPGAVDASAAEQFALELCGGKPTVHELRALGALWMGAGDATLARAIELHNQAARECSPDDKDLWVDVNRDLANLYYAAKRFAEAAATYDAMLKVDPDRVDVLNNYAYLTASELKDPAKALPFAERALQLQPQSAAILDTVGWVHFLAGNYAKAQEHLRESVRLARTPGVLVHLAEAQLRNGDIQGARLSLDDASRLNPDASQRAAIQRIADEIRAGSGPGR